MQNLPPSTVKKLFNPLSLSPVLGMFVLVSCQGPTPEGQREYDRLHPRLTEWPRADDRTEDFADASIDNPDPEGTPQTRASPDAGSAMHEFNGNAVDDLKRQLREQEKLAAAGDPDAEEWVREHKSDIQMAEFGQMFNDAMIRR